MRPWVQLLVREMRARATLTGAEPEAVAELAFWSASSDGVLDDAEVDEISALLAQLPGLEGFDAPRARSLVEHLAEAYVSEEAIAARILELTVSVRSHDARKACYQLAVWSAARDGQFTEEEAGFLESLQEALELSDSEADELLDATVEAG
jgi:tellurite resistance protein